MKTLVMGKAGALRDGIVEALAEAGEATAIEPDHEDPFDAALGRHAIVWIGASSLGGPVSDDALEAALTAAHAPGVEVLVAVLPLEGGEPAVDRLAQDGVPYVVLRAPMLIEELGQTLEDGRWLLVANDETMRALDKGSLADAVRDALETEQQGRVVQLGSELAASEALQRAAAAAGKRARVVALWPPLVRALRWLGRLLPRERPVLGSAETLALPAGTR